MRTVLCLLLLLVGLTVSPVSALNPDSIATAGRVRVTAYSPNLVRIEPAVAGGANTFYDNTSFVVVDRDSFEGIPIKQSAHSVSADGSTSTTTFSTASYDVVVQQTAVAPPTPSPAPIGKVMDNTDVYYGTLVASCSTVDLNSPCVAATDATTCQDACAKDASCTAWVLNSHIGGCKLYAWAFGTQSISGRTLGGALGASSQTPTGVSVTVKDHSGATLWQSSDLAGVTTKLNVPGPADGAAAFAFQDFPRFFAPSWAVKPTSGHDLNGYDFSQNTPGDSYVFLLGGDLASYFDARQSLLSLTGPTPRLPDWSFGTWFTFWHQYTESEAKNDISNWDGGNGSAIPIDVWALDMNWRKTSNGQNYYYNHPDTALFPDFAQNSTAWFDFLVSKKLRTYFNDHPFPANNGTAYQLTSPEVNFRWDGLSHWMEKGLTYWWYDHNWKFSIPPPNTVYDFQHDGMDWVGNFSNIEWGAHVYHTTVSQFIADNPNRAHSMPISRSLTLTKYAYDNCKPGVLQYAGPGHHRYPVWWTGDGVTLQASVESMTASGVHSVKPYVHSDCGGDYRGSAGDLLRWTGHCAFGSILRFHGADHRPWTYDAQTRSVIQSYIETRYRMMPSIISAGAATVYSGFPLVARCDLVFPAGGAAAASNDQYLFLNSTLVAPIWDMNGKQPAHNVSTRSVWLPPGDWQDSWSGDVVSGGTTGKMINATQPYARIPLWTQRGSMVVTSEANVRVESQDWSRLYIQSFVDATSGSPSSTSMTLFERGADDVATVVSVESNGLGAVSVTVEPTETAMGIPAVTERTWVVRAHLRRCERVTSASADGTDADFVHVSPSLSAAGQVFPYDVAGTPPAPNAGPIVDITVNPSSGSHAVVFHVEATPDC